MPFDSEHFRKHFALPEDIPNETLQELNIRIERCRKAKNIPLVLAFGDNGANADHPVPFPQAATAQWLMEADSKAADWLPEHQQLVLADISVNRYFPGLEHVHSIKVARSTHNFIFMDALERPRAIQAYMAGRKFYEDDLNSPGILAISAISSGSLLCAAALSDALQKTPLDKGLTTKLLPAEAMRQLKRRNRHQLLTHSDPELLDAFGSYELVFFSGLIAAAVQSEALILLEGDQAILAGIVFARQFPDYRNHLLALDNGTDEMLNRLLAETGIIGMHMKAERSDSSPYQGLLSKFLEKANTFPASNY